MAADHDVSIFTLTPSVVLRINIGWDPGNFLFRGGAEGNGQISVTLHDAIFEKSDCYHDVAMTIGVTSDKRIKWLVEEGWIGSYAPYNKLSNLDKHLVNSHMPLLLGY